MKGKAGWRGLAAVQGVLQGELANSDLVSLNQALWRLSNQRKPELMTQAATQCGHLQLREGHYTALIDGLLCTQKTAQAVSVYYQAQIFNVSLDCAILSDLLAGLILAKAEIDNVECIWERMAKESMIPPANICSKLLLYCMKNAQWLLATKVLSLMLKSDLELPHKLITSLLSRSKNSDQQQDFLQIWEQTEEMSIPKRRKGLQFVLVLPRK